MDANSSPRITPVILSGGSGTRLWPLSRSARPKQLLALIGEETMLQATARRTCDRALFDPPIVVGNAKHADAIEEQLGDGGLGALILEPAARNTAPAIALAALAVSEQDLLLVLPSDQLIRDVDAFLEAVRRASPLAAAGWLVTFGMKSERPETGYGYIQRGEEIASGAHRAARFVEKPDLETARAYCADGSYDWNGGIFLFTAGAYLEALRLHAPAMFDAASAAVAGQRVEGRRLHPDAARFGASPSQSIDYAVMEKAERIAVVPVSMGWSDVGSWEALHEVSEIDAAGNAIIGDVLAPDSQGCLIRSDGPMVAAIGVQDLVIVAMNDAVLIMPKSQSQRVKDVVDSLKAKGSELL